MNTHDDKLEQAINRYRAARAELKAARKRRDDAADEMRYAESRHAAASKEAEMARLALESAIEQDDSGATP